MTRGGVLAEKPKLDKASKLARTPKGSKLARTHELDEGNKLARTPKLDKGGELAETLKLLWVFAFAAVVQVALLPPRLPAITFGIIMPINLRPIPATGVPPGGIVIVLAFVAAVAAAAASTFEGGGVGVCYILASLGESWV